MIQFKHYHDPKTGYADAVSKDCTSEDKRIFQTISSFKRSRDKETCFTYLPVNKKAYLMQATKDGIYEYFHGLAQDIADFRETYKIDFEICFKDKIYIRFYTGNMFEPKMFGKIEDNYSVYQFYVITKFAKELVEKLGIDN